MKLLILRSHRHSREKVSRFYVQSFNLTIPGWERSGGPLINFLHSGTSSSVVTGSSSNSGFHHTAVQLMKHSIGTDGESRSNNTNPASLQSLVCSGVLYWLYCAVHLLFSCLCREITYHMDFLQIWHSNYVLWTDWHDFDVFVWIYYFIHSFTHLFICSPILPFILLPIDPFIHLFANPSYCRSHPFIHLSILLFVLCLCSYNSLLVSPYSH